MHGEYLDWVPLYIGLRLRSVILHSWLYWVCTSKILITCGHAKWGSLIVIWKGLFLLTKINHWEEWVGKWRDVLLPMRMLDEWWWLVWNYGLLTFVFIYFCCCWENVTFVFEFEYGIYSHMMWKIMLASCNSWPLYYRGPYELYFAWCFILDVCFFK